MPDFTLHQYNSFVQTLRDSAYQVFTFNEYLNYRGNGKKIILRHDVDLRPHISLETARLEYECGIKSTYYFRIGPTSFNEYIIREIESLGHEIGYHYEELSQTRGNIDAAYNLFCRNLEKMRKVASITTICMHGSPLSRFDSRDIWDKFEYRKLDLIGEPYFDIDFSKTLYLTDTGRCWNGKHVSIRDKPRYLNGNSLQKNFEFQTTNQIIEAAKNDLLPQEIMITTHPQRWTNNIIKWTQEYCLQNIKNSVKYLIVKANQASLF